MSHSPLFSIVIPTYNRRDLLQQALESVLEQQFHDFELLVVDDGSTEDIGSLIDVYRDRLPVTLLRQENSGPAAARNCGAAAARGEYLAFLDSDDAWFPWTLSAYQAALQSANSPAMIIGRGLWFRDCDELREASMEPLDCSVFQDFFTSARSLRWAGSGGLLIRRHDFLRIGGFCTELRVAEDLDLLLRMGTSKGFALVNTPVTFAYRQHAENSINNVSATLRGSLYLIHAESRDHYPGGSARRAERLQLLTRFLRPPSFAALRAGYLREAWTIYRSSFLWHVQLRRIKYLAGFPLLAFLSKFRATPVPRRMRVKS